MGHNGIHALLHSLFHRTIIVLHQPTRQYQLLACCHLVMLCGITCSKLNYSFSLSPNYALDTFCIEIRTAKHFWLFRVSNQRTKKRPEIICLTLTKLEFFSTDFI
jgi:hypothetical protein